MKKTIQRRIGLFAAGAMALSAAFCCACSVTPEPTIELKSGEVNLSAEGGIYTEGFTLYAYPYQSGNKIYYTTDGSEPTTSSTLYSDGIEISDVTETAEYLLTDSVRADWGYGEYDYGHIMAGVPLRFIEVDSSGEVVAERTVTYVVTSERYSSILSSEPIIFLTADSSEWVGAGGIYTNQWDDSLSLRAEMEYYDYSTNERYFVNTQVKIGGKWTRGYPQHTLNLNFKHDEDGNDNADSGASFFGDRERRDGEGLLGSVMRMRLHNGGNAWTTAFFSDAFVQRAAENLNVSTTAYRPCSVFLNGEYWGTYAMREKYSRDYFKQNYGIKSKNIIYADRYVGNPSEIYINGTTYKTYGFSLDTTDGEEEEAYKMLGELFSFVQSNDLTDDEAYAQFSDMVDVDSLLDCILVNGYVCNWDFFYNNLRMWRVAEVDPDNPYADGKWRFCLHDTDFSFNESPQANNGLTERDRRAGKNYFDFYVGDACMSYSNVGYISDEYCSILSAPLKNATFKERMQERALAVAEAFSYDTASAVLGDMKDEVADLWKTSITRWGAKFYSKGAWSSSVKTISNNLKERPNYFYDELTSAYGLKF